VNESRYVLRPRADRDLDEQAQAFERILILYLPLSDGVEVLRVVHGSRNLQALLRREGIG
jgi:plasmid stabilization system protein ParE